MFKIIGGLIAIGLIWIFQLVLAAGLVVGYAIVVQFIARAAGVNVDDRTVQNIGIGLSFALALATIFWLERKSRRYGLDFLFTWLPF